MASEPRTAPDEFEGVLSPSTTAFDFLEGSFARSQRSRLAGLGMVGSAIIALAGTLVWGSVATADKGAQEELLAQVQSQQIEVANELGQLDAAEGIPTAQIEGHISARTSALQQAVGDEISSVGLVRSLQASAPVGVTITEARFGSASATPSEGEKAASAAPLTVTAQVNGFALIATWSQALKQIPGLSDIDVSWSGGGDSVAVTVTANLTDEALSIRAQSAGPVLPSALAPTEQPLED